MKNVAVLCSGVGSNLQALITAVRKGTLRAKIALVVSDRVDAYALVRARKAGIPVLFIDPAGCKNRAEHDAGVVRALKKHAIDYVVLAGYMRILSPFVVRRFRNKIINIHPALLPSFKGAHGIQDALDYGAKVTGVTVHFVNEELDAGPILLQAAVAVKDDDTRDSLTQRIHRLEHRLYPRAVNLLIQEKTIVKGRKVSVRK
jgi:phosphoribosylglycinamide formyltransferase-1